MPRNSDPTHWSFDKRIPIVLIVTLVVQTATAVWWAATIDTRVNGAYIAIAESTERDMRQWERIRALEIANAARAADAQEIRSVVLGLKESIGLMRSDIKDTNTFLQAILRDKPLSPRSTQ